MLSVNYHIESNGTKSTFVHDLIELIGVRQNLSLKLGKKSVDDKTVF